MKNDLPITHTTTIPGHEIEITTSKSGGPGGQHANKTDTRITVRWNVKTTSALQEEERVRVIQKLGPVLTTEGDLIIHSSASRSQQQNKKIALELLAEKVRKALYIPKKRKATKVPEGVNASRLKSKSHRSTIKKMRSKAQYDE